jgi:hypothetical protein
MKNIFGLNSPLLLSLGVLARDRTMISVRIYKLKIKKLNF